MRILIVSERFYPESGAAAIRLKNMLDGLKSQGNIVDVLTGLPNYPKGEIFDGYKRCLHKKEVLEGSHIYRYWCYATISPNPIKRAINMLSFAIMIWGFVFKIQTCKSYDKILIQTPTLFVATSALILFKYVYGKKCILNVSDIWPSTAVDMGAMRKGSLSYRVMLWCEKFLYKYSDAILGQSKEILTHVSKEVTDKELFLYRNLQRYSLEVPIKKNKNNCTKFVFAGMLGSAQDVYGIVKNIDFNKIGTEFHIYGMGTQYDKLLEFVRENKNSNVFVHGAVPKEEMENIYNSFDVAIVPLVVRIYGAFPSKIYDIVPKGMPILFSGGGEAAEFIKENKIGFVAKEGDYEGLREEIEKFRDISVDDYSEMSQRCIDLYLKELSFEEQIVKVNKFIQNI